MAFYIIRYNSLPLGLNGDSLLDQARVEMIGDCVGDYIEVPCKAFTKMADDDTKVRVGFDLHRI